MSDITFTAKHAEELRERFGFSAGDLSGLEIRVGMPVWIAANIMHRHADNSKDYVEFVQGEIRTFDGAGDFLDGEIFTKAHAEELRERFGISAADLGGLEIRAGMPVSIAAGIMYHHAAIREDRVAIMQSEIRNFDGAGEFLDGEVSDG